MRKKRPQQWTSDRWWLHQDNAPCHKSMLVTTWMADRDMKTVRHPSYSPDLAPYDFFLFPRMKDVLRGIRFQSTEEMKKKIEKFLERTAEEGILGGLPEMGATREEGCKGRWQLF